MRHGLSHLLDTTTLHGRRTAPRLSPALRVLVAVGDPAARIELSAELVSAGLRIALARRPRDMAMLLPSVDIAIADARLLRGLGPRARYTLAGVSAVLAIGDRETESAEELGATALFRRPIAIDTVVAAAVRAAWSLA